MKRSIIPYNSNLKELAQELRNNGTPGEIKLWQCLKGKRFLGFDFHRQKPLLNYIVDFYCYEINLVIEIDGIYHTKEEAYLKDVNRTAELQKHGLTILRFMETEVIRDITNVLRTLETYIEEFKKRTHP
ncbi:DUF559 domain-containing protein [Mucilaginibacter sp. RS28]|uniref:DUF559 domain-containing protein n=1 Tax=Mucilaginibacter straminoryzae TaxID=2932774 RepID=A0A9X2B917_9SPHI|nr:DUF559 domain-containing protein [Mucilaginibacter straminoryzae]MCJ8210164.1 DUF559 domain-containing protein [Mucilaginibacter straminoryzae]